MKKTKAYIEWRNKMRKEKINVATLLLAICFMALIIGA